MIYLPWSVRAREGRCGQVGLGKEQLVDDRSERIWIRIVNNRLNDRSDCVSPDKLGRLLDDEPLLHMVHRGDD